MIDLLPNIQNIAISKNIKPGKIEESVIIENKAFREFIIKINLSQQYLKTLTKSISEIKNKRNLLHKTNSGREIDLVKEDINDNIENCKEIQNAIKDMILENEKFVKDTKTEDSVYDRLVNNLYFSCLKRFEIVSDKLSKEQSNMSNFLKQTLIKEAQIAANYKLSEEECDQIVENPYLLKEIVNNKLQNEEAHIDLINKVNDLELRHNDIVNLEKNINSVNELFSDLQELVKNQGQIIENIELNIANAKDLTLNAELDIAISYNNIKKSKKKKCIVLIIAVVIIVILLGTILPISF